MTDLREAYNLENFGDDDEVVDDLYCNADNDAPFWFDGRAGPVTEKYKGSKQDINDPDSCYVCHQSSYEGNEITGCNWSGSGTDGKACTGSAKTCTVYKTPPMGKDTVYFVPAQQGECTTRDYVEKCSGLAEDACLKSFTCAKDDWGESCFKCNYFEKEGVCSEKCAKSEHDGESPTSSPYDLPITPQCWQKDNRWGADTGRNFCRAPSSWNQTKQGGEPTGKTYLGILNDKDDKSYQSYIPSNGKRSIVCDNGCTTAIEEGSNPLAQGTCEFAKEDGLNDCASLLRWMNAQQDRMSCRDFFGGDCGKGYGSTDQDNMIDPTQFEWHVEANAKSHAEHKCPIPHGLPVSDVKSGYLRYCTLWGVPKS